MIRRLWCLMLLSLCTAAAAAPDPRVVAAQQELGILADAEETCAVFSSIYVSLESLNDLGSQSFSTPWDWINDQGGSFFIRPSLGSFDAQRRLFSTQFGAPNEWAGPFVTYQSGTTQTGATPYDRGSPLDPWGQPYLFYSPLGLLRGDSGAVTLEFYGDQFDRYTLVSFGPDGIQSGDDLLWQFGGGVTAFALSSITGPGVNLSRLASMPSAIHLSAAGSPVFSAPTAAAITLRGVNLGPTAAGAQVFFNSRDISAAITAWRVAGATTSKTEIDLGLPGDLFGRGQLVVQRGTARTNALTLNLPLPNAAPDWLLYR